MGDSSRAGDGSGRVLSAAELRDYRGAPLCVFLGVSTGGSLAHRAFPALADLLLPGTALAGVDLPADAPAEQFRRVMHTMQDNPDIRCCVVTSHKLRLFRAVADSAAAAPDPLVRLAKEVNSARLDDPVQLFARDPESLQLVLAGMQVSAATTPAIVCIGAGGAATALLMAIGLDIDATLEHGSAQRRASTIPLTVVDLDAAALQELQAVRERCGLGGAEITLTLAAGPSELEALLLRSPAGSLVINATGLGKTGPGSPIRDGGALPPGTRAWDFNYRGPLTFLGQAREHGALAVDGWSYFLAGWTAALCAIAGRRFTPDLLSEAASRLLPLAPAQ